MARGEELDIGEFTTATNTLRRPLNDLGLERRMRDITPNIESYLAKSQDLGGGSCCLTPAVIHHPGVSAVFGLRQHADAIAMVAF